MKVALVAAIARNRVIGFRGALCWKLGSDLARFRRLTMGHHVLMGRHTHESIGRPLPGRTNVIVTRQEGYMAPGCVVVHAPDEAMALARSSGESLAFVIGGGQLYAHALPFADELHLSWVDAEVEGDAWFPAFDPNPYRTVSREEVPKSDRDEYAYRYEVMVRREPR